MANDPTSLASKIVSEISSKTTRKGIAIQGIIAGIILLFLHFITSTSDPNSIVVKTVQPYLTASMWYAGISLIATAYLVIQRPFLTPEVKTVLCPICTIPMSSITLHCEKCKGTFNTGSK